MADKRPLANYSGSMQELAVGDTVPAANGGTGLTSPGASGNVLTSNGTGWVSQASGGGASTQWVVKTAAYTALTGDAIQANTSAGAFAITLPVSPAANDLVRIADYAGTFATSNLTVGRNGSNIMGLAEDMTISTNNISIALQYIDATQGWRVV